MKHIFGIYRYGSWLLLLIISAGAAVAQEPVQLTRSASDCTGAIWINDNAIGPVYSPKGFGNELEISGYELGDPYFIQREHNTVWYRFRVPYNSIFSFDLVPILKDDDFDFMLFHYDGPNFCRQVADGKKIPVRTNISRKNLEVEGKTGLHASEVYEYVPSGPGSSYSRSLKVNEGEVYYLLVDNPFRENKGHSVFLYFEKVEPRTDTTEVVEDFSYKIPLRKLRVSVTDQEAGERIASNIAIDNLPDSVTSRFTDLSQVEVDVLGYRTYDIHVVKKDYLPASESFTPRNDSLYEVNLTLKRMKLGDRINLENIKFDKDQTTIMARSQGALDQLVDFLKENPNIHIELQGHVNGESKRNKRRYRKLSTARAKAIHEKLIDRGIDASRLEYKGFGNARMIFPTPVNERQAEANRRVEAEITEL